MRKLLLSTLLLGAACARPAMRSDAAFHSDRITVTTQGTGPDVILVPGLNTSANVWQGTVAAVPGYRYHLVQVAGFAGAPARGNATGPVVQPVAMEIVRYIREQGLSRPAFVGHSLGGSIGLTVATQEPDALSRLLVVDMIPFVGAFYTPPGNATVESARAVAEGLRTAWRATDAAAWRRVNERFVNGMVRTEALRKSVIESGTASDRVVSSQALYDVVPLDMRPVLGRIGIPLTVLYVESPTVSAKGAALDAVYREQYANAPRAKLKRIPDA